MSAVFWVWDQMLFKCIISCPRNHQVRQVLSSLPLDGGSGRQGDPPTLTQLTRGKGPVHIALAEFQVHFRAPVLPTRCLNVDTPSKRDFPLTKKEGCLIAAFAKKGPNMREGERSHKTEGTG